MLLALCLGLMQLSMAQQEVSTEGMIHEVSIQFVLDHAMFLTIVFEPYGHKKCTKINGEWKIECMSLEKMVTEPEPRDMTAGTKAHSVHIEFCVS